MRKNTAIYCTGFLLAAFVIWARDGGGIKFEWFSGWEAYLQTLDARIPNKFVLTALDIVVRWGSILIPVLILAYLGIRVKHLFLRESVLVSDPEDADYPRRERDPRRDATEAQKRAVFERAKYRCEVCGHHVFVGNFPTGPRWLAALKVSMGYRPGHVGHIFPYELGGETELPNLSAQCSTCNLSAGKRLQGMYLDFVLRDLHKRKKKLWRGVL